MDDSAARQLLDAERTRLTEGLRGLGESFDDIVEAARDSNLDDEHDPEGSTIAAERSMISSITGGVRSHLAAVEHALARLDAGTYRTCERCGGPIAEARLEARPVATTCIRCAKAG
ncbi:MAG: TraR/DksA family transcriptional regulator [Micrococcales bacterium]|nr:TraR/DksA family transcriptional regulator [Micrococcales bacterium]